MGTARGEQGGERLEGSGDLAVTCLDALQREDLGGGCP